MEGLLSLPAVSSQYEVRDVRHLYNTVESHVRGLRALGVSTESYGGMLTYIIMSKSPAKIHFIVNCELTDPSLNESIYTVPNFGQSIFDIFVRFRLHRVAVAGDIEKAFLMVSMSEEDLRFF